VHMLVKHGETIDKRTLWAWTAYRCSPVMRSSER
jgi:hypothetical protein